MSWKITLVAAPGTEIRAEDRVPVPGGGTKPASELQPGDIICTMPDGSYQAVVDTVEEVE